ncbi:MAG: ParB/RepB/Spo0J family partition protein [Patescibacteria group bacterium]
MPLGKGLNSLIPQQQKIVRKIIRRETGIVSDENKILNIAIEQILPNPEQPRKDFDHQDLEDLVLSIKKHGILQPLIVTEREDGNYELIAGERRLRASQIAGLEKVPAILRNASQQQKLELALIENIQRQQLNPLEEAYAYSRLMEEFNLSQEEVADQVGKSRPVVANTVRLLGLPSVIQTALVKGEISMTKARTLLSLKSEKEQIALFTKIQNEKMTSREVESVVSSKDPKSRKGSVRRDPNIRVQEELLEESLGTKVRISKKGERGSIIIDYFSLEELKRLIEELTKI